MVPILLRCGILTEVDLPCLALYCHTFSRWVEATEHVRAEGAVIDSYNGPVRSVWLRIATDAEAQMCKGMSMLGMTPTDRSRVSKAGGPVEKKDPWARLN